MGGPVADIYRTRTPFRKVARLLCDAMKDLPNPRLAVSGGSAAEALGSLRHLMGPHWKRVRLTWVDERQVPFNHPDSNRGEAFRLGYLEIHDPPALELSLFHDGETGEEACMRVEAALRGNFEAGLDFLMLGLGEDGHIGSLFPGHPWPKGLVHAVEDSPKPPPLRISLGQELLASAPMSVLVALGEGKVPALRRLLAGAPDLPAGALKGLRIVTDQDLKVNRGSHHE
ncbi:MAG: 6-phosphogluconolactonase [Thermoanaerobaculaceae bacterium]|nr:6-phosphogluconolactonase [Thermoanaerobaculaceae bacterium]